jgi:HEPN domain
MGKKSKQELAQSHPASPASYLRGARDFHEGLRLLVTAGPTPPGAVTALLAAQSVETGLKGFLLQVGWDERRVTGLGHNLEEAWRKAQENGLAVAVDPPQWCETLSTAQDGRFLARYPRVNSGLVVPATVPLVRDIGELLDKVADGIKSRGGVV